MRMLGIIRCIVITMCLAVAGMGIMLRQVNGNSCLFFYGDGNIKTE